MSSCPRRLQGGFGGNATSPTKRRAIERPQSEAVIWNIALATSLPQETTAISLILTDHDTEPNEEENQEKEEEEEMVGDSDSDSLDDHDEVIPPPPGLMYYPVSEAGGLNLPEVHLID